MIRRTSMPHRSTVEVALLITVIFFFALLEAMLAPAFPVILKAFNAGAAESGWFTSASLVGTALAVPVLGRLADLYDKGRIVLCITCAALLGAVVCFCAPSYPVLLFGQMLIGLSYALHPLGIALMAELLPTEKVAHGAGFVMGAAVSGTTLGLVSAGPVMDAYGYQGIYAAPSAVLVILTALLFQARRGRPAGRAGPNSAMSIDWNGAALLAAGTSLLLGLIIKGQAMGWNAPTTLLMIAGFVLCSIIWVKIERRHVSPIVDLSFFRSRELNMAYVVCAVCGIGAIGPGMLIPLILQASPAGGMGGHDVTSTGLLLLPFGIAASIAALMSGTMRRLLGGNLCLVLGVTLLCAGNFCLWRWHDAAWMVAVGMAITGAGIGISSAETMNIIVSITGARRAASACSVAYVIKGIASMASAQVCAAFLGAATNSATRITSSSGYSNGFQFCIALCFVGVLAALAAHRPPAGGGVRRA